MFYIPKMYTVESVTSGHPDKVCDQISDAILDECLKQDPKSRVAVETFGSHGLLVIGGEVTSNASVDYASIVRRVYQSIGYEDNLNIISYVVSQSPDIALGVDTGGAGDQGIMYGYATNETKEYLPKGVVFAHRLTKGLEYLRKSRKIQWLKPDGKAQATLESGKIKSILVSTQHDESVSQEEIRSTLIRELIAPLVSEFNEDIANVQILTNPTGKFVQGGFDADAGLTGRKIMVDTYGGLIPHGGGCFSGKDATKVDRSAAYMCRFVAKNLVAQDFAEQCLISVAYAIGRAEPLMVDAINEKGESLVEFVKSRYDFRPTAIIEKLGLRQPIYSQTAAYGHFGNPNFPWERVIE